MNKNSFLTIELRKVQSKLIHKGGRYKILIKINIEQTPLLKDKIYQSDEGEIVINQNFVFTLLNEKIKRTTICVVEIWDDDSPCLLGEVLFMVMDYKNYSRKIFEIRKCNDQSATLQMNTNISFSDPSESKELRIKSPRKQLRSSVNSTYKKQRERRHSQLLRNQINGVIKKPQNIADRQQQNVKVSFSISKPPVFDIRMSSFFQDRGDSNIKMSESIEDKVDSAISESVQFTKPMHLPISEVKIQCVSNENKQAKSTLSIFEKSGIVIQSKEELSKEEKQKGDVSEEFNFSLNPNNINKINANNDNNFLKIPDAKNISSSIRLTGSHHGEDSRFAKDIQQNLDSLSILQNETSRLSKTRSPLKNEGNEIEIFDTLRKMKSKFEKIHEKQAMLNNDLDLDVFLTENHKSDHYSMNQPRNELKKSINVQSYHSLERPQHSFINSFTNNKQLYLNQTVNIMIKPKNACIKKKMRIERTLSLHYQSGNRKKASEEEEAFGEEKVKRLWSAVAHIPTNKQIREEQIKQEEVQSTYLRQTYKKFDLEETQLQKMNYMKLNKISYLAEATHLAKRKNTFLMLANDQMIAAQQRLDQKLQISKRIIAQKQSMMTDQFLKLQEQIRVITLKLSKTNQQAKKREEMVVILQNERQKYSRQNNTLKQEIKKQAKNLQQLRFYLALTQRKITEEEQTNTNNAAATSIKAIVQNGGQRTSRSLLQKGQSKQKTVYGMTGEKRGGSGSKPVTEREFKVNTQSNSFGVEQFKMDGLADRSSSFERFRYRKSESFCLDSTNNKTDKCLVNKLLQYTPKDFTKRNR